MRRHDTTQQAALKGQIVPIAASGGAAHHPARNRLLWRATKMGALLAAILAGGCGYSPFEFANPGVLISQVEGRFTVPNEQQALEVPLHIDVSFPAPNSLEPISGIGSHVDVLIAARTNPPMEGVTVLSTSRDPLVDPGLASVDLRVNDLLECEIGERSSCQADLILHIPRNGSEITEGTWHATATVLDTADPPQLPDDTFIELTSPDP